MKKFLLVLLILFLVFAGYIIYDNKFMNKIPILNLEEQIVEIDEIYVYGTHLNIHGCKINDSNLKLVLYNGEFIEFEINSSDNGFNLSDYVNDGLYLDDIPVGEYYLFLRSEETIDEKVSYKYYALKNTTNYKETTYYTMSNFNKKIIISSEETYPTMLINVTDNKDNEVYDIVIDPGHGGMDGGANKYGYTESQITMSLALKLKKSLEDSGFKVKLTREEEQLSNYETLPEYGIHGRAVVPREVNAKYLISLHMNSNNYSSVNGLEVYTAADINYNLAKSLVKNITSITGLNYSNNKINKVFDGIYTRTFTEENIQNSFNEYDTKGLNHYDITTKSNYYYIIRETGGIITGAYVDDRNEKILGNPYVKSNVGTETYLLELGYISNESNLNNMINNMDKYALAITTSFQSLNDTED